MALQEVWPWGEDASVEVVGRRLAPRWPTSPVEAAIWKVVADAAAEGHLLVDLERFTLDRTLPLALLPPDAAPIVPDPLPDTLLPEPVGDVATVTLESGTRESGPTFDASRLPSKQREQFHRNLRAVALLLIILMIGAGFLYYLGKNFGKIYAGVYLGCVSLAIMAYIVANILLNQSSPQGLKPQELELQLGCHVAFILLIVGFVLPLKDVGSVICKF